MGSHNKSMLVNPVVEDKHGYIWFAGDNALNRWDGKSVTAFRHDPEDSTSLPDGIIFHMFCSSDGKLWMLCKGLRYYDEATNKFIKFFQNKDEPPAVSNMVGLVEDKDGNLYANYRGSASNEARRRRSTAHPNDHTFNSYEVNEGYDGWIKVSGSVADFVTHYNNTLRVVMWYVGVKNLSDLRAHAKLLRLSPESHKDLLHKISSYQLKEKHTNGKSLTNGYSVPTIQS